MFDIKTKTKNFEKILVKIDKSFLHLYDRIMDELYHSGNELRNAIQDSMHNTVKSGKKVRKTKSGKVHYPSAPGHPPAVDTGELINRIHVDLRRKKAEMEVGVIAGAPYGKMLEEGTKPYTITAKRAKGLSDGYTFFGKKVNHPGIKPRPFLQPAIDKEAPTIRKNISDAIEKAIRDMKR